VECDVAAIEALGVRCVAGNFIAEHEVARHATDRLCSELLRLAVQREENDVCSGLAGANP